MRWLQVLTSVADDARGVAFLGCRSGAVLQELPPDARRRRPTATPAAAANAAAANAATKAATAKATTPPHSTSPWS